jgi:hypothetical protein
MAFMTPALDAFPDLVHEIVNYVEDQEISAWEFRIRGTHTERLVSSPIGDLNSTRKAIELRAAGFATFRDGRMASYRNYFSPTEIMSQLGLLEGQTPPSST